MVSADNPTCPVFRSNVGPIATLAHPSITVYVISLECFGSAAYLLTAGVAYDDSDLDLEGDAADPDEMTYEASSCNACLLLFQECSCLCLRGICVAAAAANTLALQNAAVLLHCISSFMHACSACAIRREPTLPRYSRTTGHLLEAGLGHLCSVQGMRLGKHPACNSRFMT